MRQSRAWAGTCGVLPAKRETNLASCNARALLQVCAMAKSWHHISSLVELAKDRGLIGQILRYYDFALHAADKWAEENAENQEKQRDNHRLPFPDTWQYLIEAPVTSPVHTKVFRAAQSQLPALRHLSHMLQGFASLNKDWYQTGLMARKTGNKLLYNKAMGKVAAAIVLYEPVWQDVVRHGNVTVSLDAKRRLELRRKQLIHRGLGNQAREPRKFPTWTEFRKAHRLPTALAFYWVRIGDTGLPGLMFWRNEALAKFLTFWTGQSDNPAGVKKIRQNLGLILVESRNHPVWDVELEPLVKKVCRIKILQRNGETLFHGQLRFKD